MKKPLKPWTCSKCKGDIPKKSGRPPKLCESCFMASTSVSDSRKKKRLGRRSIAPASAAGPGCAVAGCPGQLDRAGACSCCAKRAAYLLEHMPRRHCQICGGVIAGRAIKVCAACRPVRNKVSIATSASHAPRS
jgi:hypothetical protein